MPEIMDGVPTNVGNAFKYNYALVSRISRSFAETSNFDMKPGADIDIDKARSEFEQFVETLRRIMVDVIELPCDELHPDGVFINDAAVVLNGTALICNPPSSKNKPSREGEVRAALILAGSLCHCITMTHLMKYNCLLTLICCDL